ncbi:MULTISPECIES: DUF4244 domain-containing protein [Curtobacterium]|uniref:DUF4244 domain-containing protein n=1 Tax=Curtobacterium TaxID=2034 RepID=UPI00217EE673|nr:DUF4244 domain-containing protein [Curtobacterium flaccumfaciens]MCS6562092.1 DUF4244 domain-containing protein [Curtobacterium flaccumfaciens pv. poinsettiae]UXN28175.1 DUF4244 domain-containing protein [Curtobacterium flaccumfaciens]
MSTTSSPDRRTRRAVRRRRPRPPVARWSSRLRDDRGSATAEYAVVILAAVAFAGVLVAVMRSGEVQTILSDLVRGALSL